MFVAAAARGPPLRGRRGPLACLALLFLGGAAAMAMASASSPSGAAARVDCWFVEEATGRGGGSVMPGALSQRRALLLLPPPGRRLDQAALESELPPEVEPGLAFQMLDPSGTLWGGSDHSSPRPFWLGSDPSDTEAVSCEINAYIPHEAHVQWAAGLEQGKGCPRSMGQGKWFIATVQNPEAGYGFSSILNEEEALPWKQEAVAGSRITTTTAVLSVFSRTPQLQARLGQDVLIDCGFSGPASPFSVEWRLQHGGAGRVVLAYDGAARKVSVAEKGTRLFLDPETNNVSLQLQGVAARQEGTYICTVYLPHLRAQQAMELKVVEPPTVTLRPDPLSVPPGAPVELACEVSGFYPQKTSVNWRRKSPGGTPEALVETWESGHRQSPDGTYSFTSHARILPVQPQDHGASYSCHVAHPGLAEGGLRKTVKLHVAGSSGPSLEDAIGCFLIAFALFGFLQAFLRRASGEQKKSEKLE
ncbi:tapasin isoform X1 [Pogona vitticeps]